MKQPDLDPRIEAIRSDESIGRGTCSSLDECYSDQELLDELDSFTPCEGLEFDTRTIPGALAWAHWAEGLWRDQCEDVQSHIF